MSPEDQRIAIAEACGWKPTLITGLTWRGWCKSYEDPKLCATPIDGLPDYLNDLNLMHEVEKVITEDDGDEYFTHLESVCQEALIMDGTSHYLSFKTISATAYQRAEAFLKTIGKWE